MENRKIEFRNIDNTEYQLLQEELEIYKDQHDSLKFELKSLIHDNELLSKFIKDTFESKTSNPEDNVDRNLIYNLETQLALALKEKSLSYELWQNSLNTINQLEEELKCYSGNDTEYIKKNKYEKLKSDYEENLQQNTNKFKRIIHDLEKSNKLSENNLIACQSKLNEAINNYESALNKLKGKDKELINLKQEILNLQSEFKENNLYKDVLRLKEEESKIIVSEAVAVAETAIREKDEAYLRETQAKEESLKLSKTVSEIINEAGDKVKSEVELVKAQYNEKIKELLKDMKTMQAELSKKNSEIDTIMKNCDEYKNEMTKFKTPHLFTEDNNYAQLLITERKLENLRQKLMLSERQNIKISSERDVIKVEFDQMLYEFEKSTKEYDIQKNKLNQEISSLKSALSLSNNNLIEYSANIGELNLQINTLESEIKNLLEIQRIYRSKRQKRNLFEYHNSNSIQKELQAQLETVYSLKNRWQTEMRDIIVKLQKRVMELKAENNKLHTIIKDNNLQVNR